MSSSENNVARQPGLKISTFREDLWRVDPDFSATLREPIGGRLSAAGSRDDDPLLLSWRELNHKPDSLFRKQSGELPFTILPDGTISKHLDLDGLFIYNGSEKLLVVFHGALARETYTLPRWEFKRALAGFEGSILFLQDPTLYVHDNLTLGWYVGTEDDDGHLMVRELVEKAIAVLEPRQVVFTGSSGGGFASLAVSAHFPDSTSLVFSPQTSIERYLQPHRTRLISSAFPNLDPSGIQLEHMKDRLDMGALYSTERLNKIYYIQNAGDLSHIEAHCIPFVEVVGRSSGDQAAQRLRVEYKYLGHGHQPPRPHRFRAFVEDVFRA